MATEQKISINTKRDSVSICVIDSSESDDENAPNDTKRNQETSKGKTIGCVTTDVKEESGCQKQSKMFKVRKTGETKIQSASMKVNIESQNDGRGAVDMEKPLVKTPKPVGKVFVLQGGELLPLEVKEKSSNDTASLPYKKNIIKIVKTSELVSLSQNSLGKRKTKNQDCDVEHESELSTGKDSTPKVAAVPSILCAVRKKTDTLRKSNTENAKVQKALVRNDKSCHEGAEMDGDDEDFNPRPTKKRLRIPPKKYQGTEEEKSRISIWTKNKRHRVLKAKVQNQKNEQTCNIKVEPQPYVELHSAEGAEYDPDLATVIKLTGTCKTEPVDDEWQNLDEMGDQDGRFDDCESAENGIYGGDETDEAASENKHALINRKPALSKESRKNKTSLDSRIVTVRNPGKFAKSVIFQCSTCGYTSKYKCSVKRHVETCGNEVSSNRRSCIFPNCEVKFYHVSQMIKHMELMHSASIGVKNLIFDSFQEFLTWKEKEETSNFTYFTKHRGDTQRKNGVYSIYICQNDGSNKSHRKFDQPPRLTNRKYRKGSIKTGATCPSRMVVTTEQNRVMVKYYFSHNHELKFENTQFHPIARKSADYIKKRFALGASPKQVQDELRNKAVCREKIDGEESYVKGQMISLRALYAIKHEFLTSFRLDKDDSNSVFLLVKEWEKKEFNPVFLYKPQCCPTVIGKSNPFFPLETELFLIAMQTKEQLETLCSVSSCTFCIDTIFCCDRLGYYLVNLIVHNEDGNTVPVAHFICNKRTEAVLDFFLLNVKDRCPNLKVSGVMTDPDNIGLEAAKSVFGGYIRHVVCQWHTKRRWQKKVESLAESEYQSELMCALTAMLQETDENALRNIILGFKVKYESAVPKFIEFFQTHIANQPDKWAGCYQVTGYERALNMHCKSFHEKLDVFFTKSKAKKRVDDLLLLLLRIEEENAKERKKGVETSICYPKWGDFIVGNHAKSLDIADGDVAELDGSWRVICQQDRNRVFEVIKIQEECLEDFCSPVCQDLPCGNLCSHLYTCTCENTSGLCEHIHKVHSGKSNVIIICSPDEPSSTEDSMEVVLHEDPLEPEPTEDHKKMLLISACENLGQIGAFVNQPHIQRALLPHIVTVLEELVAKCREASVM